MESQTPTQPAIPDVKHNSYVLVQYKSGKKNVKCYVGLVIHIDSALLEYTIKFLRLVKDNMFIFPDHDDVALVNVEDIRGVLHDPALKINKRRSITYCFSNDFTQIKNLC